MGFNDTGFDDFDSFSGFDDSNGFGDFNSGGFDDNNFNNGNFVDDSFADMNPSNGGQGGQSQDMGGNQFENMFNDQGNLSDADDNSKENLKKTAVIAAIVGVVIILAVILVASMLGKKNKEEVTDNGVTIVEQPQQNNQAPVQNNNNASNTKPTTSVLSEWKVINGNENIEFNSEYSTLMFLITGIEHKARVTGNSVVVKTVLTGSLGGMSGVYELEVPYSVGVSLHTGNEIETKVLVGSFNGNTVIGDIKY